MVRKIFNKAISAVTTTLLAFTTLASAIPVTTYAASPTVKSKTELKKQSDPAGAGFGTFVYSSSQLLNTKFPYTIISSFTFFSTYTLPK